ncbi:MAG: flagellar basal-body rod protein FlgF [Candidatus Kryptoniota bacterium]
MIKGIYTSALGLIPLQKKLEVVANNLANLNTTAFKRDDAFVDELINAKTLFRDGTIDPTAKDVLQKTYTDYSQGPLEQTNNSLDVAISGDGFFVVETPDGVRLTRDGSFTLSSGGILTTRDGSVVMGNGGPIRIDNMQQLKSDSLVIDRDGTVKAGQRIYGQIRVVVPQDYSQISKVGNSLYSISDLAILHDIDPQSLNLRQGFLEGSNVNPIDEMIALIELQRNFEVGQKAIQSQDDSLAQANQVGKI